MCPNLHAEKSIKLQVVSAPKFDLISVSLACRTSRPGGTPGGIRLAPLAVLFGANSTGKSSLGHWLLALKQTVQSTDRRRALHLGDDRSLVDLGTYRDCISGHHLEDWLGFGLRWSLPYSVDAYRVLTSSPS